MNTKPIYHLPTLKASQEWACEGACDVVRPKLHRNVYRQTWDAKGTLLEQRAEHYYTCQNGHLLTAWDNATEDYAELPPESYITPVNTFGLSLSDIEQFLIQMNEDAEQYRTDNNKPDMEVRSFKIITLQGEVIEITMSYLYEIRAQLSVRPIQ